MRVHGPFAARPSLNGLPEESFACPEDLEAAENHMTEDGEHVAVYEAQCARNGNEGFDGEDGFPLCCACGGEFSEHKAMRAVSAEALDVIERLLRGDADGGAYPFTTKAETAALVAEVRARRSEHDRCDKALAEGSVASLCEECRREADARHEREELKATVARLRGVLKLIAGPCERWYANGPASDAAKTHAKDGKPLQVMGSPSCLEDGTPSTMRCSSCKARGALGLGAGDEVPA